MIRSSVAALMTIAAAIIVASSAQAVRYTVTYVGVIASGNDDFAEFGDPATLIGSRAIVTFLIDTTYGDPIETNDPHALQHEFFVKGSPEQLPVTVFANGVTRSYAAPDFSIDEYEQATFPPLDPDSYRYTYYASDTLYSPQHYAASIRLSGAVDSNDPYLLSKPLGTALSAGNFGGAEDHGLIDIQRFDINGAATANTQLIYQIGSITIAAAPAVPEPASWALMTIGLALVGGRLRARPAGLASRA